MEEGIVNYELGWIPEWQPAENGFEFLMHI